MAKKVKGGSGKTLNAKTKQPKARPVGPYTTTMTGKTGKMPNCPSKI